jgi:hypothetical protein
MVLLLYIPWIPSSLLSLYERLAPDPLNAHVAKKPTPTRIPTMANSWKSGLFDCFNDCGDCGLPRVPMRPPQTPMRRKSSPAHARSKQQHNHDKRDENVCHLPRFPPSPFCTGLCVSCCYPCAYGQLVEMLKNPQGTSSGPTGDCGACMSLYCVSVCCPCLTWAVSMGTRTGLRTKFDLKVCVLKSMSVLTLQTDSRHPLARVECVQAEPCGDCCVHFCCEPCAICQERREIKLQVASGGGPGAKEMQRA